MAAAADSQALKHLLISASAGSGKTYQLVRRYLHLLALGQEAEGIAAMTFTRKAAGEFFSRILQRLAEMAETPEKAALFFQDMQPPVRADLEYGRLLRRLTRRMHRLSLGTLDSFFAKVTACFPMELGLPAGARVMDEDETAQARREALDSLLQRLYQDPEERGQKALMEAYKQATFGAEEKTVDRTLQDWLAGGLTLWEESAAGLTSETRGWGEVRRIWPQALEAADLMGAIEELRASFVPLSDAGADLLEETLQAVLETVPGMSLPKRTKELLEKAQANWRELLAGDAELMWMRKKTPVKGAAARALVRLVRTLMGREFVVRAARTRGLSSVIELLSQEYARQVRNRGRLSFADVQRLLSTASTQEGSWVKGAGELWFRLDGQHQHWLLDEFQDTSRVQWQVIGGLVDEVLQDGGGERSFFAVGDPKQSIYLWRQAEPDLFEDILRNYPPAARGGLHTARLSQSFRSAQPVLDAVNAVFSDRATLETLLPEGALKGFAFETHTAAQTKLTGHAALISPSPEADLEEPTTALTAQLLQHIQPLQRGLSCAVLVRSNKDAREITETLRSLTGMEIVCESDLHPCMDNAVTLSLLSILSLAAHPGDHRALEHLRMTPLWQSGAATEREEEKLSDRGWRYAVSKVQNLVVEQGFAAFLKAWTPRVKQAHPQMDAFHARRLAQMADIAAEFDAQGNRDLDDFIRFAREYPLRTRGVTQAVQVMTIHASKGLEFDVVILPRLDGSAMDLARQEDLLVSRGASGVRWVLESPPKIYAQLDSVLSAELIETKRRTAFESLCRLYVAMTRAKRGLYFITETPTKSNAALKESKLLRETLGRQGERLLQEGSAAVVEWETGDERWFVQHAFVPTPVPEPLVLHSPLGEVLKQTQPMPRRRTPSGEESFKIKGTVLFGQGREPGRRLGTLVHELMAEVEWTTSLPDLEKRWLSKGLLMLDEVQMEPAQGPVGQALHLVRGVLESTSCQSPFIRPSPQAQLWRERSFDLVLHEEWISGTFDRVILERDSEGRYVSAWIVDFKTDEVAHEAALEEKLAGYRPQLQLYRRAVAKLAAVDESAVRCSLLFMRLQRLVDL
ncbi:ATP-dependent exoDNAse (exonuclease V) beta subunit (contains helicase and exonuclease domains) [Prosthecobacter debontii]|uniref:DNA 3'-5' helicase n=1 Tax=Prosthecobacter debontii TaxID=48467 RepID=A0A1T4Z433_9BACT|nr:UvrD-helicase domain-containing protein [Prosthecobacter debontii]SKB08790.1 ATP-dependent exoDNAse (exonuclease V) beta subunit (contains helicase and exonuclease domains) [Prosthecobacter debontii]